MINIIKEFYDKSMFITNTDIDNKVLENLYNKNFNRVKFKDLGMGEYFITSYDKAFVPYEHLPFAVQLFKKISKSQGLLICATLHYSRIVGEGNHINNFSWGSTVLKIDNK